MITTVTTAVTTTTTTTIIAAEQIVGIGIFAVVSLIVLLILRDISMVELESRKSEGGEHVFLSSIVSSSKLVIMPLMYIFLSIILYRIILIL